MWTVKLYVDELNALCEALGLVRYGVTVAPMC
jgi:hypothetical protein